MPTRKDQSTTSESPVIGPYTFEEYLEVCREFHHYPAPGLLLGGFMVDAARRRLPEGALFDAVSETSWCLPDAIQILTPCTVGNGWLKVFNLGLYALTLYDKTDGAGVRVALDSARLEEWSEIKTWLFKLKPKKEQDSELLREQIRRAGATVCDIREVRVRQEHRMRRGKGRVAPCPVCGQPYPTEDGAVCRLCRGESPYAGALGAARGRSMEVNGPPHKVVPVEQAVGLRAAHDMTGIEPGRSKGPLFRRGQEIQAGDLCRLHKIGRKNLYVFEPVPGEDWVHEDEAAKAFARAMAGDGVLPAGPPREGKVELAAAREGLFLADAEALARFNMVPDVMAACRKSGGRVSKGSGVAGTRAIPLHISRENFDRAMGVLSDGPLFRVLPMRKARAGVLITGDEVFYGRIEDRFEEVIRGKVLEAGSEVVAVEVVPDERERVAEGARRLLDEGCDLIITTAGLSVDPDDVTRMGLADAGLSDVVYGAPLLPGAMTLLGRLGNADVIGVPACALFFKTTSLDVVLPRVLAGVETTRRDLAGLGHGGYCLGCKVCTWPKCSFGN
jgi:formylmethanofuran dehydrogenase subunit E